MATLQTLFTSFLLLLILHLGCFIFSSPDHPKTSPKLQKKPNSFKRKASKAISSSWSFLKKILHKPDTKPESITSPASSTSSQPDPLPCSGPEISSDPLLLPLRNDIYPCPVCGEIFQKQNLLEHHQATRHAVSELYDGDSSKNIIQIIFNSGWPSKVQSPIIDRVMKIQHGPKILARFEDYRESVKIRAAKSSKAARFMANPRCIADGNELLRFYCTTFICDLGRNGNSSVCHGQYCSLCGIIKSGFSPKLDGIATWSTGWRGHMAVPEEIEEEFGFMNVRRAMLVCRVIAGQVGCGSEFEGKDDPGLDSVVGSGFGCGNGLDGEDELLVFNPRAVLPCFVIVYTI